VDAPLHGSVEPGAVVVVTGAAGGIGAELCRHLAAQGAAVVAADVAEPSWDAAGLDVTSLHADVADEASWAELVAAVLERHGRVDALVNNAGKTTDQRHMFDGDESWWDEYIRINLKSQYLCIDRAARLMARAGGGAIVNLSSGGGTRAHRGMVAYDASKGGVEALTRATALELAPYGIRVNTLVPGLIATFPDEPQWSLERRDATVPLGRGGRAEDLAGPAVFLVSDDAAYVTGSTLVVDGGVLVQQRSPQVDTLRPEDYPRVEDL
jgi:NAD(P)-dependent dehydrogenase (short-subunit alcohol dehydrogenase family)